MSQLRSNGALGGQGETNGWESFGILTESASLSYETTVEGINSLQKIAYGEEALKLGSKYVTRSFTGVGLLTSIIQGNEQGWQNHNYADVTISTVETVAAFVEVSNPVGWAILGVEALYFIGNEIYKNYNNGHSITQDLFDKQ
jgi:hypothetical protein